MTKDTKDEKQSDKDAPNAAMLRDDIDSGETGDKIGFPDPSAAPLGTDAEAGGNPATREEMKVAREAETSRPDERQPSKARPSSATDD
jgi:hypothetical protein